MSELIRKYFDYFVEKKIFAGAISVITAHMFLGIIKKFTNEWVLPKSRGEDPKIIYSEYVALLINIFITTFILFVILNKYILVPYNVIG